MKIIMSMKKTDEETMDMENLRLLMVKVDWLIEKCDMACI